MSQKRDDKMKNFQALILAENIDSLDDFFCLKPCPIESPLEKTLQQLERFQFNDIFIFCSIHYHQVEEFINNRKSRSKIKIIQDLESNTFASVMRTIYTRKLMSEDFILINAHLISDVNLEKLKETYQQISEKQKGLLMMEVFQNKKDFGEETTLVVYDKVNHLMNFYEKDNTKNFIFEDNYRYAFKSWFKEDFQGDIKFRFNVQLAGMSFCSKELFGIIHTMNEFMMQRETFLKEVLTSQISTQQLALQFVKDSDFHQRCNRPHDFYKTAIFCIKSCFNYFYVDHNLFNLSDMNKFIAKSATVSIHSQIGDNCFIGDNVKIQEKTQISGSIICQGASIDQQCIIKDSYLISEVQVEEECVLENCYVMEAIVIKKKTVLKNKYFNGGSWQDVEKMKIDSKECWDENSYCLESDEEEEIMSEQNMEELEELLERYYQNPETLREVVTEVKSFWLGEGIEQEKRFESLFEIILNKYIGQSSESYLKSLSKLTNFKSLLNCFMDEDSDFEQKIILKNCEQFCRQNESCKIHLILQKLYQEELLTDDVLLDWGEQMKQSNDQNDQANFKLMEKFLEWLDQSEEESEDGSEEESEEESDQLIYNEISQVINKPNQIFDFCISWLFIIHFNLRILCRQYRSKSYRYQSSINFLFAKNNLL